MQRERGEREGEGKWERGGKREGGERERERGEREREGERVVNGVTCLGENRTV